MITIDTHSFEESLLTPGGWVLDIGCRNFSFAKQLAAMGLNVLACDPDTSMEDPKIEKVIFVNAAVEAISGVKLYATWSTGEGNYICNEAPWYSTAYTVPCRTIREIMDQYGVIKFDLIKMDCEGSEYDLLRHMPEGCTKQLSVEFHDFLSRNPYFPDNKKYYDEIFAGPLKDFEVIKHDLRSMLPDGSGPVNYWDSVFKAKENG